MVLFVATTCKRSPAEGSVSPVALLKWFLMYATAFPGHPLKTNKKILPGFLSGPSYTSNKLH